MGDYLDRTYAASDGVILSYRGDAATVSVPRRLAAMDVVGIGAGSFMESDEVERAIIPHGVRRIGKKAFASCKKLRDVQIPDSVCFVGQGAFADCPMLSDIALCDLTVSEREYLGMRSACRKTNGGEYLARVFPDIKIIKDTAAAADARPPVFIPEHIGELFSSRDLKGDSGAEALTRTREALFFDGPSSAVSEAERIAGSIRENAEPDTDSEAEAKNDGFIRTGTFPDAEKTALFSFDDSKTRAEKGKYHISANIRVGYHFWQSFVPVISDGKRYYIYRRNFLSPDAGIKYVRRDTAVFSDKGLVISKAEAQAVYAKYKLLSIL